MKSSHQVGYWFLVAAFVASIVVSWNLYFKKYHQQDSVNIHEFPRVIAEWNGIDLKISEEEYAILETRNAFARRYINPLGQNIYLLIVYSQNNRKVSHPPEICYTGSGIDILEKHLTAIHLADQNLVIQANRLFLEKGEVQQVSYYWFKVGEAYTADYWHQQILIALKTLLGKPASSALIRISANVGEGGMEAAEARIEQFIGMISSDLKTYLP
jgi:EpsI family protein